jgi:hypothetical protein
MVKPKLCKILISISIFAFASCLGPLSENDLPRNTGSLKIVTDPDEATVSIDGKPGLKAPTLLDKIDTGFHSIIVSMGGYADTAFEVHIEKDKEVSSVIELKCHRAGKWSGDTSYYDRDIQDAFSIVSFQIDEKGFIDSMRVTIRLGMYDTQLEPSNYCDLPLLASGLGRVYHDNFRVYVKNIFYPDSIAIDGVFKSDGSAAGRFASWYSKHNPFCGITVRGIVNGVPVEPRQSNFGGPWIAKMVP